MGESTALYKICDAGISGFKAMADTDAAETLRANHAGIIEWQIIVFIFVCDDEPKLIWDTSPLCVCGEWTCVTQTTIKSSPD